MKLHNTSPSAKVLWNPQKNVRLQLEPGINEISEENYGLFKGKIDADLQLAVVVRMNDSMKMPKKAKAEAEAPKAEEEPAPEPQPEEAAPECDDACPADAEEPKAQGGRRGRRS